MMMKNLVIRMLYRLGFGVHVNFILFRKPVPLEEITKWNTKLNLIFDVFYRMCRNYNLEIKYFLTLE